MKLKLFYVLGLFLIGAALYSFTTVENSTAGDPWEIPAKYQKMTNPVKTSTASKAAGKAVYRKHCASCHGKVGLGDGPKAAELDGGCGDFSSAEFKAQADGVLYYKSFIGRDDMPNFEKKIADDEDRWNVVNYLKSL